MGVGVGQGAETVVIFLTSGIPEGELDVLAVNLNVGDVVLEDSGNVDLYGRESQYMCAWTGSKRGCCCDGGARRPG